jgi:hypothetical protein
MEYFKYMYDLLVEKEQGTLRYLVEVEVILPYEIEELQAYGLLVFTHQMMVVLWDYKE